MLMLIHNQTKKNNDQNEQMKRQTNKLMLLLLYTTVYLLITRGVFTLIAADLAARDDIDRVRPTGANARPIAALWFYVFALWPWEWMIVIINEHTDIAVSLRINAWKLNFLIYLNW